MGLNTPYLRYIESSIEQVFGDEAASLSMLELGDQVISDSDTPEETGKDYFMSRGFEHVSVDLNGLHGALVRDLTKPDEFKDWHGSWDVITNAGTTEHVEPFDSQYECFQIIHDCMKDGGVAIHLVPDVDELDKHGAWKNHCRYYYSESFFKLLAQECKYELLSNTVINGLRCAAVRKTNDVPFMDQRDRFLEFIAQREPIVQQKPITQPELVTQDAPVIQRASITPAKITRIFLRRIGIGKLLRQIGLR